MSNGIDAITAAALGALQGLTEFLPVSSSGHVAVGAAFFGVRDHSLAFTVFLHLGTLFATLLLLRREVVSLLRESVACLSNPKRLVETPEGKLIVAIVIATLITGVVGLLLRHAAETFSHNLRLVGVGFLVSAAVLLASRGANGTRDEIVWQVAIVIGLVQGVAVLPGISRSGATIAAAMLLGIRGPAAFRYSFLISLPAILGAAILESLGSGGFGSLGAPAWIGGATALVTGYLALVILRRIILVGRLWMFALYLIPLGLFLVAR
ncbi:MAG: undecaprenyl-diphosphate phosphatase [Myxococcota bacterium]